MKAIVEVLLAYHLDVGRIPSTREGLRVLGPPAGDAGAEASSRPHFEDPRDLADAWKRPIRYAARLVGGAPTFELRSAGRDGKWHTPDDIVMGPPASFAARNASPHGASLRTATPPMISATPR